MYAAVLTGEKQIDIKQVDKPAITANEVLVKVELCGICGTDLHAYQHPGLYPNGTIFGHESSGTVAEVNEGLEDEPGLINSDCYGGGWLVKLSGFDAGELDNLMDAGAYKELLASEE